VNTFISLGMWGAWLLFGTLLSASLDSIPDFPAVLKQAGARQAIQCGSHSDPAARAHRSVPAGVIPALPPSLSVQSISAMFESAPLRVPGNLRFVIWRASDSSPPQSYI
jgi:hypothetical protein